VAVYVPVRDCESVAVLDVDAVGAYVAEKPAQLPLVDKLRTGSLERPELEPLFFFETAAGVIVTLPTAHAGASEIPVVSDAIELHADVLPAADRAAMRNW
jgi:hypothetical protein